MPGRVLGFPEYLRATLPKHWSADVPHINLIAEHLDAVHRGEVDRLAIHMPPRHAKTETVSVRFGPFCLQCDPTENVLITGYNERFARRLGRRARNVFTGRTDLDRSKTASDEWATKEGGVLMARGVGSPPTGVGFRRIIIDDPIRRREDADSAVYREKVWDWYTDDLYTRLEPGGAIVLVMTRWHEDDLGFRAIESESNRWTVLRLPAIAEPGDPLGRPEGAPLWPERFSSEALARIREVMARNGGERGWQALYQQNPTPREGSLFLVGRLEPVDARPGGLPSCRAWDLAATSDAGDWTAGVRIDGPDSAGIWYVEPLRFRHEPAQRNARILETAQADGVSTAIRVPIDPGAAGKEAAQAMVRLLSGFNVRAKRVTGSKVSRAEPFAAQLNAGNVRLVRNEFSTAYLEELRQAPGGAFDDFVDATADAFNELAPGSWSWTW